MKQVPHSDLFFQLQSYFNYVKEPMDLSTVKAKLEEGQYNDREQLASDVRLIATNAQLYNLPESHIYILSEKFLKFFNKRESQTASSSLARRGTDAFAFWSQNGTSSTVCRVTIAPLNIRFLTEDTLPFSVQASLATTPRSQTLRPRLRRPRSSSPRRRPPPCPHHLSRPAPYRHPLQTFLSGRRPSSS